MFPLPSLQTRIRKIGEEKKTGIRHLEQLAKVFKKENKARHTLSTEAICFISVEA